MRRGKCHELEALIDREAHGWSEAERLRVEQHLTGCASCREVLATSRFVRETLRAAQGGLSEQARSRALSRAFAGAAVAQERQTSRARGLWLGLGASALAAAAAVLLWWSTALDAPRASQAVVSSETSESEADRYVASETLAPRQTVESAAPTRWIAVRSKERRSFGHASVVLAAGTRVRFEDADSTLLLSSGKVAVDVDASRGQAFRVATQHFRVEVLGTRFVVTPQTVVVTRGHVQVFALDGRVLASDLAAGSAYSYTAPAESRTAPSRAVAAAPRAPSPAAVVEPRPAPSAAPSIAEPRPTAEPRPAPSAQLWLQRAREALSRGDVSEALQLVERAESSQPRRGDRAEAGTLRAEAALLGKQDRQAIDAYASVAEQYADLPAGENAAFAAAQLAARSQPARERPLLQRYLARHPRGRFADEAKRRLAQLAP